MTEEYRTVLKVGDERYLRTLHSLLWSDTSDGREIKVQLSFQNVRAHCVPSEGEMIMREMKR